jgi:hypothetical protein
MLSAELIRERQLGEYLSKIKKEPLFFYCNTTTIFYIVIVFYYHLTDRCFLVISLAAQPDRRTADSI